MKKVKKYYRKLTNHATETLTSIALERFVKSDYLRETANILPLTLLTIATRTIFNFLITSRIKTGNFSIDFPISLTVTVIFSLYSPVLYHVYSQFYGAEVDYFSAVVILNFYTEGWTFVDFWKTRILGILGTLTIIILFFVEINSRMIQETIFHTMISSLIVDYLTNLKIATYRTKIIEPPKRKLEKIDESYKTESPERRSDKIYEPRIIEEYQNEDRPPQFGTDF